MIKVFFRFFVEAPALAMWVFIRSPRNIRRERWVAWRLARAYRLRRKLSRKKLHHLEKLCEKNLLEKATHIGACTIHENGRIRWRETYILAC